MGPDSRSAATSPGREGRNSGKEAVGGAVEPQREVAGPEATNPDTRPTESRAAREEFTIGTLLAGQGQFADAVAAYRRAAERRGITSKLGELLVKHGEFEQAAVVYRRVLERNDQPPANTRRKGAAVQPDASGSGTDDGGPGKRPGGAAARKMRMAPVVLVVSLVAAVTVGLMSGGKPSAPTARRAVESANVAPGSPAAALPTVLHPAFIPKPAAPAKPKHRAIRPQAKRARVAAHRRRSRPAPSSPSPPSSGGQSGSGGGTTFVSTGRGGSSSGGSGGGSSGGGSSGSSTPVPASTGGSSGGGGGGSSSGGSGGGTHTSSSSAAPASGTGVSSGSDVASSGTGTAIGGG